MATTLNVEKREKVGKYIAFELRKDGKIPAVVYGPALKENLNLTVNQKDLKQVLASGARVIDLDIAGKKQMAVVKDIQHAVIGNAILHADFRAVDEKTLLHLSVEIVMKGDALGLAQGGIIEQNLHHVAVECLPHKLPAKIELDIANLNVGNVWFVSDLPKIDGVKYATHAEIPVVSCHIKTEEAAAAPVAAEETAAADAATKPADAKAAPAAKTDAKPAAKK